MAAGRRRCGPRSDRCSWRCLGTATAASNRRSCPSNARRVEGFDEAIISLSAKGLTTGEIASHLAEVYGTTVSRELISKVTDKVVDELTNWQNRPLDRVYPVVFVDALHVKIRDGQVANRPIYVVLGITATANATCSDSGPAPAARAPNTG